MEDGTSEEVLLSACKHGEVGQVRGLLDEGGVDINAVGPDGNTALHLSIQNEERTIAFFLLKAGCDVNRQNASGETALFLAARVGDLDSVQLLLDFGADKRIEDNEGRTPYFVATSMTHSEVATELLPSEREVPQRNTDVPTGSFFGAMEAEGNGTEATASKHERLETKTREDEQHLRHAAETGDIVGVKEILKHTPEIAIDAVDDQGYTALYRASLYGRTQVVDYLLKHGANPDMRDRDGATPLHAAASKGYGKIMRLLLAETENVNVQDMLGTTPLLSATVSGSTDVLKALLEFGADVNIPNNNQETPVWAATANGHEDFVRVLLEIGVSGAIVDVNVPDAIRHQTPLHLAAGRGDTYVAKLLLEHGADKDVRDASGCTPLFVAADKGRARMVAFLLDRDISINAVNKLGETALFVAAADGHVPVTQELLKRGADTEIADAHGWTPLMSAAREGHIAILSELLQAFAKVDAANNIGETPLMIAALEGYQNAAGLLIENGADIDTARNDGRTALHMAAMDGHTGVVTILLAAAEAELEASLIDMSNPMSSISPLHLTTDTWGDTALHLAARYRQVSVMKRLLEYDTSFREERTPASIYGQLVAIPNKFGWTALHLAVDRAHQGAVRLLLEHSANVHASDKFGNTPVHLAARGVDHRILLELLSVDATAAGTLNADVRSPLHFAAACVRPSSVRSLLNAGADVSTTDADKRQLLDVLGSVEVCNPPTVEEEGLCHHADDRPDMCPIPLGTKNDLIETKRILQVALKNQNKTHHCGYSCNSVLYQNDAGFQQNQKNAPASTVMADGDSTSITAPIYGLLIPALFLVLLFACGLSYFIWRRWFRNRDEDDLSHHGTCSSRRHPKKKQHQPGDDRIDDATSHMHHAIARKNTFEMMKSILAELPSAPQHAVSSRSGSSDSSDSSCGWSDDSEDRHTSDHNAYGSSGPSDGRHVCPMGLFFHQDDSAHLNATYK